MRLTLPTLVAAYGISGACMCLEPPPPAEQRLRMLITVHARILANEPYGDSGLEVRKVTAAVLKDYSLEPGNLPDTLVFWTPVQSSLCGTNPPVGEEALLFGDTTWSAVERGMGPSANTFSTGLCAGNVRGQALAGALAELEAAAALRIPHSAARPAGPPARYRPGTGVLFLGRYGADGRCAPDRDGLRPGR